MSRSAPKLFIGYRREETASYAGRLYDAMATRFGASNVFMDIELEPGLDFVEHIVKVVSACHAFLVIIGPTWATIPDSHGRPRIAGKEDYVRLEVETALRRTDVRVIPLLVAGARMPHSEELPEELRALTRRNAHELSDLRWHYDVQLLADTLKEVLETHTVPVPPPAEPVTGTPPRAASGAQAGEPRGPEPKRRIGTEIAAHRLEALVGRGETGVVYRARDLELDRVVALKLIAPEFAEDREFRERFMRESRQAGAIEHPNVIPIHRVGEDGDLLFISMDYVEGTDLKTFIGVRGRLDPGPAASVASQVAAGLEAAHARGLVHRDVKPANVLIDGQERVYLTGFGVTKRTGPGSAVEKPDLIVGTRDYLAPEQIREDQVDARTDVYALGCVLYEALTGFVPYPRERAADTMWAHVNEGPPSVLDRAPDVPIEFDIVVRRAMANEPDQRFISAEAMRRAIDAAARGAGLRLGRGPVPTPASEPGLDEPKPEVASKPRSPATPASTRAGREADAGRGAALRLRRSPRMLVAFAGVGLALIIAVVLLVAGGGEDSPTSRALRSAPPAPELPAGLTWRSIRDAPFRRQYAAATAADGEVWVFGGLGPHAQWASTATKVYDPAQGTWRTGPGLPLALHHLVAVTYEGVPVLIGGFVGDPRTSVASDSVYALRAGEWDRLPPLKHPRAAAAAAVVDGKIVVVGGEADGELVAQTELYDGERWTDVAPILTPRQHLGAAADGRYVYAVGGKDLSTDLPTLERYDPVTDRWDELTPMPTPSDGLAAAYVSGRLITVGGESATSASDAVQAYEIRKQTWSQPPQLPNLPSARHGVAVTTLGDAVYAIGGATRPKHVDASNAAEILDLTGTQAPTPEKLEWRAIRDAPFPRQYAAAAAVPGTVYLIGGLGETGSTETAEFDPVLNHWAKGPPLPQPLHHLTAVTYEEKVVVMGGFVGADPRTSVASDRVYALRAGEWEELPPLKHPRAAAAAAVVDGRIVVVGGQADGELVAQTELYDGERWRDVAAIPTPREHLGAASDDRYLYAVGGRVLSPNRNRTALERYDPDSDRWEELAPMPIAAGSVGLTYVDGRLVAVGGEGPTSASADVWAYDIRKRTWSQAQELPDLPSARHGVAVTTLDGSVYAIGGAAKAKHVEPTKTAAVLDFD
jgi:N-acetylneuraminic acid mutarotase